MAVRLYTHIIKSELSRNASEFYLKGNYLYKQIPAQMRRSNFPRDDTFKSRLRYLSENYLPKKKYIIVINAIHSNYMGAFPVILTHGIHFLFNLETTDSIITCIDLCKVIYEVGVMAEFQLH